jgi:hypothetical protein
MYDQEVSAMPTGQVAAVSQRLVGEGRGGIETCSYPPHG